MTDLTPRQREVLAQLREGKTNVQIAEALGATEKTVKGHLTAIFKALGVTNRTRAALHAVRAEVGA